MKIFMGFIILLISSASFAGDCADVNADNYLNSTDILYIIDHLYRGGPAPDCETTYLYVCGDVNADNKLNLLDVSYIIRSLYSRGPEPLCNAVKDIDGNIYQAVKIGNQWWMAENLKVTHYRNGDAIPNVAVNAAWQGLSIGAYCEYNNDVNNVATYGRLYNGYAVADSRNIAPTGWHVPSDAEWKQLEMYLGMSQSEADGLAVRGTTEGGKMKEAGTTHWLNPNAGATNESGFSGLPGGYRGYNGSYYGIGGIADFWSSTEYSSSYAWLRGLNYSFSEVYHLYDFNKRYGFSVRCVQD